MPTTKTVPISVRISDEDAEFIAGLRIEGAHTPSEKMRALIAEARRRQQWPRDYAGSRAWVESVLASALRAVRNAEVDLERHSEAITLVAEWLPDIMAYILTGVPPDYEINEPQELAQLEQGVVDRVFRLLESMLRLAVTEECPCYDTHVVDRRMHSVLALAEVIRIRKGKEEE